MVGVNKIVGVDINFVKCEFVEKFGMIYFVNFKEIKEDFVFYLVNFIDGGVDYFFECVGNVNVM